MPTITIQQGEPMKLVAVAGFDPATMVVEQPFEAGMDPQTLFWGSTRSFVGLKSTLVALSPQIGGIQQIRHHEGDFYQLIAQFSALTPSANPTPAQLNAQIKVVWSLSPARLTKDLWQKPSAVAALAKIADPGWRAWLRNAIETIARGEFQVPALPKEQTQDPPKLSDKTTGDIAVTFKSAIALAKLTDAAAIAELAGQLASRSKGVTSYPVASVVLRKTRIAPLLAPLAAPDFDGVGKVVTTAALLRVETTIPASIKTGILNTASSVRAGYWFKEMPGLDQRDATRLDVETHFTFTDDYDPYVYGPALT
jgi:hypothetical protein